MVVCSIILNFSIIIKHLIGVEPISTCVENKRFNHSAKDVNNNLYITNNIILLFFYLLNIII